SKRSPDVGPPRIAGSGIEGSGRLRQAERTPLESRVGEGARPGLRPRADRRGRLRPDGHRRPAARGDRARRQRPGNRATRGARGARGGRTDRGRPPDHSARRGRRPGRGDGALHRAPQGGRRRAGGELRRALHDSPRAGDAQQSPGRRGRGGASAHDVPRMVEQPPLKPRRGHTARRAAAITALLVGLLVVGAIAWQVSAHTGTSSPPPPPPPTTTGPPPQKVLHIVFPEGFTIRDMAARITAVDKIAESKRKVTPRLSAKAYLRAVATMQLPPAFKSFGRPKSLEGFLFPATYAFTKTTTGEQLVGQQLQAFQRAWAHLDLAYARQKNLTPYDVLIIASMIEKEVVAPKERPLVAAVIYNRLHVGFPVGIDATLRYGLHIP